MKKIYFLLFLITSYCSTTAEAQTLTATGCNPTIGEIYNRVFTGSFNAGSSGTGQTWDISALTGTSSTANIVSVASSPNAANHSAANIVFKEGTTYTYMKTSSTAYQFQGTEGPASFIYTDLEDILRYPFSYSNSYTDTWKTTFTSAGYLFTRKGTTTVTADGSGTLITANGNITNVLRVHSVQIYSDSADISGTPYIINYNNNQYFWYKDGVHFPLASTYNLTSSASGSTTGGFYTNLAVGIKENALLYNDVSIIPNPTSGNILLKYSLKKSSNVKISILNIIGEEVYINQISSESVGDHFINLDLKSLDKGIYFVKIQAELEAITEKLIIQ